jgi:hypothetical protein
MAQKAKATAEGADTQEQPARGKASLSLALDVFDRVREMLEGSARLSGPEFKHATAELREGLPLLRDKMAYLIRLETQEILADMPLWLTVSPREKEQLARLVERVLCEYPVETSEELLWCLAVAAVRPHKRGRKPKWLGTHGTVLVLEINAALEARGWKRSDRKRVRQVIAMILKDAPARYGKYSEERLRQAYYEASACDGSPTNPANRPNNRRQAVRAIR